MQKAATSKNEMTTCDVAQLFWTDLTNGKECHMLALLCTTKVKFCDDILNVSGEMKEGGHTIFYFRAFKMIF